LKTSIRTGWLALGAAITVAWLASCGGDGSTGPIDPEVAAEFEAEELAAEAATDYEDLVRSGNPDPIGALVVSMQANPNLTNVERHDSLGTVIATTTDGVPFGVMIAEMDRPEWRVVAGGPAASSRSFGFPPAFAQIACSPTNFPQSKKACLLRSTLTAAGAVQDEGIDQSLQKAGFDIANIPFPSTIPQVIQLQQTLSTCGVLYIRAHGGGVENLAGKFGNHLVTEVTGATAEEKALLKTTFGEAYKNYFGKKSSPRSGKTHLTLSPEFFASVQYPNTLVFTNACGSGNGLHGWVGGSVLQKAFRDHGAGGFVGWNTVVSAELAGKAATEFFAALAPKVVVDNVSITIAPPNPGAGQSYVVSAQITPASQGVDVSLSVRGTDGFTRDETAKTNTGGSVSFASIPGGAGGVTDSITVAVGGANDSQTAQSVIQNSPTLQTTYKLPQLLAAVGIKSLAHDEVPNFNLVCNNPKVTKTVAVVKFQSVLGSPAQVIRR
jgi:hypothetical protein